MDYLILVLIVMLGAVFLLSAFRIYRRAKRPSRMGAMLEEQKRSTEIMERIAVALEKMAAK